jgi:hypothetical protein
MLSEEHASRPFIVGALAGYRIFIWNIVASHCHNPLDRSMNPLVLIKKLLDRSHRPAGSICL